MGSVTQDASSLRYVPADTSEWQQILSGTGLNAPSSIWLCQESSGNLADSGSGGRTITVTGTPTYRATASGWSRVGVKPTDNTATYGSCTIPDVNANSALLLQFFSLNTPASALRGLNRFTSTASHYAGMLANNKLGAVSGPSSDAGHTQAGTFVVVTKLDRSRSEFAAYTQDEKVNPTWDAPPSSTDLLVFGHAAAASDATLVYAAFWTGSDAEMSDAQVQTLLDALEGNMTTRQKLAAGSTSFKTVVAIEGCEHLISDAPSDAVLSAWYGYDWSSVLGGLFINVQNEQSIDRDSAFTSAGRCTVRVLDQTGEDTLGKSMHRRLAGAETPITSTVDRDDTTINVKSTLNFPSSGTAFIGNEAFSYTGTTGTTFTGCTRGKWSPFQCATSGSGGTRFSGHHRVALDMNQVQMNPLVSSLPRVWVGKRVGVWLHTWDERNQTLNHRREAQLVYAGRIVQIGDDANDFCTVIELEHISKDLQTATIGRDQWRGTLAEGMFIQAGRVFRFSERLSNLSPFVANDLTVVSSGASGTNQMDEGYYSVNELAATLSAWLGGELDATRINGRYNIESPVSINDGLRTVCRWYRSSGTVLPASFDLEMPGEVFSFLGIGDGDPGTYAQMTTWHDYKWANEANITQGSCAPYESLVFKPRGPGRLAQEFNLATPYDVENESGEFIDTYSLMPYAVKGSCDSTKPWGIFLLDERVLLVGSLDNGQVSNCWLAPFQLTGDNAPDATFYIGRRLDEPERGPITLRQFICIEERWSVLIKSLLYSTGTNGYNHGTYDSLGFGLSAGIPGALLGDEFERSIDNTPGADVPVVVIIDEPTKLKELLAGDFMVRRSFLRWKDQHFEIKQWRTPLTDNSIAALTEETKASADPNPQFRCSSVLTQEFARPTIKFDYSRDFAIGRGDNYQRSFSIEDQTQVDDLGGNVALQTIKLRNTFASTSSVGAGLESLLHDYIPAMPIFRPSLSIERSFDQRYFFEIEPGDIVTVTDTFARDPISGERGIIERPAMVTSTSYTMGGFTSSGKDTQSGRITLNFFDVQRGQNFAPAAQVDETYSSGGFSAGYNSATSTLRCHANKFGTSGLTYLLSGRRVVVNQDHDATYFDDGDKVLIVEIDPANPASPTYWERTILTQSSDDITLTTGLSAPAWDATKKYRIVPQKWSQVTAAQQDWAYQADNADHKIEDDEVPFHYSASDEPATYHPKTGGERGEYLPQMCYGDGRPYDVGHERALVDTINAYIDHKSAHQSPFLVNATPLADNAGPGTWNTLFFGPIFLGMDILSSRVTRTLTVAPFWRSSDGTASELRVSIGRYMPQETLEYTATSGTWAYIEGKFTGEFSQTDTWSTSSTTWAVGADKTLTVGVKDTKTGMVWLLIEGSGKAQCRGLSKCIEGARVVG